MNAIIPMGMFTRKIHRQLAYSVSHPPRSGPSAGAIAAGMVNIEEASALSSGGNARNSMAVPTGSDTLDYPEQYQKVDVGGIHAQE